MGGRSCSGDDKESSKSSALKSPAERADRALRKWLASFEKEAKAPPTRTYKSLVTLESFNEFFDRIKLSATEKDLQNRKSEMKVFKDALNHLIALTKGAVGILKKAKTSVEEKKKKEGSRTVSGERPPNTNAVQALFEAVMEKGTAMDEVNLSTLTVPKDKCEAPFLVTNVADSFFSGEIGLNKSSYA